MSRKKHRLPFLPVPDSEKTAEYAGFQYQMESHCDRGELYNIFRDTITRLIYSNFKWYGLEDYEASLIEWMLINVGRVCAVKTSLDLNSRTPAGVWFGRYGTDIDNMEYDFYGNPMKASCSGYNGQIFKANSQADFALGFDTNAIIKSQYITPPVVTMIEPLARLLYNHYMAWRVSVETNKSGVIFQTSTAKSAKILRQALKKISENDPYIVIEGSDIVNETNILFADRADGTISAYWENFMNTWGCVMDILGLENNSSNKKERLIVSEVELNRSLSRYTSSDRLSARKRFAEELNNKFGMNVQVENYLTSTITENGNEANNYGISGMGENLRTKPMV